jgi:hypothetical protein
MSSPMFSSRRHHYDPVARAMGGGALLVALLALVFAMSGLSQAQQPEPAHATATKKPPAKKKASSKKKSTKKKVAPLPGPSKTPKKYGILRLNSKKRYPASVIPKVAAAKAADTLGGATKGDLGMNCPATAVDLGSWCLDASTYPVPTDDLGKNDFLYASKACVEAGGYLPSAAQLVGAAAHAKLSGTIDDSQLSASTDIDATDGLMDQREMTSTLVTTLSGADAAGNEGPTPGSTGDPKQGQPNPVPVAADPLPDSLQYVTVYDNHDHGGFGGSEPVGKAERFRCGYDKTQGAAVSES